MLRRLTPLALALALCSTSALAHDIGSCQTVLPEAFPDLAALTASTSVFTYERRSDPSAPWETDSRYTYTYDRSTYQGERLVQRWNTDTQSWDPSVADLIQLTPGEEFAEIVYRGFWTDAPQTADNLQRDVTEYDEAGRPLIDRRDDWDRPSQSWIPNRRLRVIRDEGGRRVSAVFERWNRTTSEWAPDYRSIPEYDAAGRQATCLMETWDADTEQWTLAGRYESTYDEAGRLLELIRQKPGASADSWTNDVQWTLEYDDRGRLHASTTAYWDHGLWDGSYRGRRVYSSDGSLSEYLSETQTQSGDWSASSRYVFEVGTGRGPVASAPAPDASPLRVATWPNPAAGAATLTVDAPAGALRVSLFDARGRSVAVLHDGPVGGTSTFALPSTLPAGVYVVRVATDTALRSETFTVVR